MQPDDDDLLAALLAGDRRDDDHDVKARLAADPELRARWERLRDVAAATQRVAAADRELLAAALREPAPGEAGVERLVRDRLRARPRHRVPVLAAAAVLLATAAALWWRSGPRDDGMLGTRWELSPTESFDATTEFRWTAPGPAEAYRLRFEGGGRTLQFETTQSSWRPNADQLGALPDPMTWEVFSLRGNEVADRSGPVSLRRR